MKPVYQVFAETKDGALVQISRVPDGARWFDVADEARATGSQVASSGNVARVWLVECRATEEIQPPAAPPRRSKEEPPPAPPDVHICHDLEAERPLVGEYNCSGDRCADRVNGTIHSKKELGEIVGLLHRLGYQVSATRISRAKVIEDPKFLHREDE